MVSEGQSTNQAHLPLRSTSNSPSPRLPFACVSFYLNPNCTQYQSYDDRPSRQACGSPCISFFLPRVLVHPSTEMFGF